MFLMWWRVVYHLGPSGLGKHKVIFGERKSRVKIHSKMTEGVPSVCMAPSPVGPVLMLGDVTPLQPRLRCVALEQPSPRKARAPVTGQYFTSLSAATYSEADFIL